MGDDLTVPIDVRFRDLDAMGHVNNAVYATYLEEARSAYYREVLGVSVEEIPTVIVGLSVEYRSSIEPGDEVTVALRVDDLGESSVSMDYDVFTDEERVATAETVQVHTDPGTGDAAPIPERYRRRIRDHHTYRPG